MFEQALWYRADSPIGHLRIRCRLMGTDTQGETAQTRSRLSRHFWARAWTIACFVTLVPGSSAAYWPPMGRAVSSQPFGNFTEAVLPDGEGGVIVAWIHYLTDTAHPTELRVQKIDRNGIPRWGSVSDGRSLASSSGLLGGTRLLEDREGGCYVGWSEDRPYEHTYLLHLGPDGCPLPGWPGEGLQIGGPGLEQDYFDMVPDGAAGVLLVWQEVNYFVGGASSDLFMTRVTAGGSAFPGWTLAGRRVCAAPGDEDMVSMIPDGTGGAVICWRDNRSEQGQSVSSTYGDIYALRVDSGGNVPPGWPEDGLGVGVAPHGQGFPVLVPDGTGGAIFAWRDDRSDSTGQDSHIFASRADGTGVLRWGQPSSGIEVIAASGYPIAISDSAGGAFIVGGAFATHLDPSGVPAPGWHTGGDPINFGGISPSAVVATADGAGGLYLGWAGYEGAASRYRVRLARILGSGAPAGSWPPAGIVVSEGLGLSSVVPGPIGTHGGSVTTDSEGAVFLSWYAGNPDGEMSVYVQRATSQAQLTSIPPIEAVSVMGNPARTTAALRVRLPATGHGHLELYDIQGRIIRRLAVEGPASEEVYTSLDVRRLPGGVYWVRCIGSDGTKGAAVKVAVVR